ncbi:MAG: hypothetical protein OD918_02470 [Gammaproteobacteria bacterium]
MSNKTKSDTAAGSKEAGRAQCARRGAARLPAKKTLPVATTPVTTGAVAPPPGVMAGAVVTTGAINPAWTIQRMFGKRAWAAEWAAELCHADPRFLLHLIDQPPGYAHFMCLVKLGMRKNDAHLSAGECARLLRAQSKKKTLRHLCPDIPHGVINVLPKLGKKPLARKDYARLLRVMRDEMLRKHLCHGKRVCRRNFAACEMLLTLPPEFQLHSVMRCLQTRADHMHLRSLIAITRHMKIKIPGEQVAREMRGMRRMKSLRAWFLEKLEARLFPAAPWDGNDAIKPLRNRAEMRAAARDFKNCIMGRNHLCRVALGYSCFYVCARPKVIIETVKDAVFGWRVGMMEAGNRKKIRAADERDIIRAFQQAGFDLPAWRSRFGHVRMVDDVWELFQ